MAADEMIQIHERMGGIVEKFYSKDTHGIFTFSWVIAGILIASVFIAYYIFLVIKIDKNIRSLLITSAFIYLFGAIVMEMSGGFYWDKFGADFIYGLLQTLEESAEMLGIAVFIRTLLEYIYLKIPGADFNIKLIK